MVLPLVKIYIIFFKKDYKVHWFKFLGCLVGWLLGRFWVPELGAWLAAGAGFVVGTVVDTLVEKGFIRLPNLFTLPDFLTEFTLPRLPSLPALPKMPSVPPSFSRFRTKKLGTNEHDFWVATLTLATYLVKADGRIDVHELGYIRAFLTNYLGVKGAEGPMVLFEKLLHVETNLEAICKQLKEKHTHFEKCAMLYMLFGIAYSDYNFSTDEDKILNKIGSHLGVPFSDFSCLEVVFGVKADREHKILKIKPSASDFEVKKAHAMQHRYWSLMKKDRPFNVLHKVSEQLVEAVDKSFDKLQAQRLL